MNESNVWEKRFSRERSARKQAEAILEKKSAALYHSNESLKAAQTDLEMQVHQRTQALETAIEQMQREVVLRREAENRLRESRDSALELSELKTQFLARMSHEMRTPLNAVIGLTGILLDSTTSPEQENHLRTVRSSGEMLLRIINDILDLSKIDADKLELEYAPVLIENILEQTISLVMLDASKKNITFKYDKNLGTHCELVLDGGRVQQLVLNLLSNAVKYSHRGRITLTAELIQDDTISPPAELIEFAPRGENQLLSITISDEGIGIAPDDMEQLFQPFTQFAEGVAAGGTGLGLTICKRLCELMGGDVHAESELGKGSTFGFTIPCRIPETTDDEAVQGSSSTVFPSTSETGAWLLSGRMNEHMIARHAEDSYKKPLSILLADDYEVNRMVQHAQLEQLGYRADAVANGEEALRALHARDYDLILMDIRMPVMDGLEATRLIRNRQSEHQPFIVAVTASAIDGDREKFVAVGMDDYISKPVDMGALAAVLSRAYDNKVKARTTMDAENMTPLDLDFSELQSRLGHATDELLRKVIPVYLRELPARQQSLSQSFAEKDVQVFAQVCHGLKGSSRSIGANELARRCEAAERQGFEGELPTQNEINDLLQLTARTAKALEAKLQSLNGETA
ncbi:MAG: ATP-binding protein [Pseudomonadota bacterium]